MPCNKQPCQGNALKSFACMPHRCGAISMAMKLSLPSKSVPSPKPQPPRAPKVTMFLFRRPRVLAIMPLSESQVQDGEQDDLANTIGTILDKVHSETVDAEVRNSTTSDDSIGPTDWHENDTCGFWPVHGTDRNTAETRTGSRYPQRPVANNYKLWFKTGNELRFEDTCVRIGRVPNNDQLGAKLATVFS